MVGVDHISILPPQTVVWVLHEGSCGVGCLIWSQVFEHLFYHFQSSEPFHNPFSAQCGHFICECTENKPSRTIKWHPASENTGKDFVFFLVESICTEVFSYFIREYLGICSKGLNYLLIYTSDYFLVRLSHHHLHLSNRVLLGEVCYIVLGDFTLEYHLTFIKGCSVHRHPLGQHHGPAVNGSVSVMCPASSVPQTLDIINAVHSSPDLPCHRNSAVSWVRPWARLPCPPCCRAIKWTVVHTQH